MEQKLLFLKKRHCSGLFKCYFLWQILVGVVKKFHFLREKKEKFSFCGTKKFIEGGFIIFFQNSKKILSPKEGKKIPKNIYCVNVVEVGEALPGHYIYLHYFIQLIKKHNFLNYPLQKNKTFSLSIHSFIISSLFFSK